MARSREIPAIRGFQPIETQDGMVLFDPERFAYVEVKNPLSDVVRDFHARRDHAELIDELCARVDAMMKETIPCGTTESYLDERHPVTTLVMFLTNDCNMRCRYCYVDKRHPSMMSVETAVTTVDLFLERYRRVENIQFFGGEPSLNLSAMRAACERVDRLYDTGMISYMPTFGMVTNGYSCPAELLDLCDRYGLGVTVSVDGPMHVHDRFRRLPNGEGTFTTVKENICRLRKSAARFSIEATYTTAHVAEGLSMVDVEALISKMFDCSDVLVYSVFQSSPTQGDFAFDRTNPEVNEYLERVICEYIGMGIKSLSTDQPKKGVVRVPIKCLCALYNRSETYPFYCGTGILAKAVAPNGDIYPCYGMVGKEEFRTGNIHEKDPFGSDDRHGIIRERLTANRKQANTDNGCDACWARRFCWQCIAAVYEETGTIHRIPEYRCRLMKRIAETIVRVAHDLSKDPDQWQRLLDNILEDVSTP